MKQVLFMAVLAAGILLAGCSKDNDDMETKGNTEQQQALTKEQIVGMWRNGDYWLSFSENGYASAFLKIGSQEFIDDGDYRIAGDTIITKASPWLLFETPYIVNYITDSEISLTIEHADPGFPDSRCKGMLTLQKSKDVACERNDGLARKFFYLTNNSGENFRYRFDDNEYKTISGTFPYVYLKPYLFFGLGGEIHIGNLTELQNDTITYRPIR